MMANGDSRLTAVDKLANDLRDEIMARKLPPETPLREEELVRRHSVSRHVVRAALRQLVADGIAVYSPFRGARVASISRDEVKDVYLARSLIESGALKFVDGNSLSDLARNHGRFAAAVAQGQWALAFELDRAFHQAIAAAPGSDSISRMHSDLFKKLELAHLVHPEFREPGLAASVAEHAEIVVALTAHSTDAANDALLRHLHRAEAELAQCFGETAQHERPRARRAQA